MMSVPERSRVNACRPLTFLSTLPSASLIAAGSLSDVIVVKTTTSWPSMRVVGIGGADAGFRIA